MWFGSLGRLNGQPVLRKQVHIFEGKGIHIFMLLSCTVSYLIFPSFNDYQFLKARKRRKKVPQKLDKVKYRNFFSQSVSICHLIIENGRPGVAAWTVSDATSFIFPLLAACLPCPDPPTGHFQIATGPLDCTLRRRERDRHSANGPRPSSGKRGSVAVAIYFFEVSSHVLFWQNFYRYVTWFRRARRFKYQHTYFWDFKVDFQLLFYHTYVEAVVAF